MGREWGFWAVLLGVAALMELWAMWLHGALWHGLLWPAHRSHHVPRRGPLEFNDLFAALHAAVAMGFVMAGLEWRVWPAAAVGFGMTLFGVAYFVVHDGLIHGRLPVAFLERSTWLRRVRDAHLVHHARTGGPYGLFLGPWELARRRDSSPLGGA
jgi:beta-carotene 3-hydroxylase